MAVSPLEKNDNAVVGDAGHVRLYCKQAGKQGAMPIFMVHGDESNKTIPGNLPEDIPFYAFYHMDESVHISKFLEIEYMAALYLEALRKIQPKGPYFLSGYSIGGLIAYEMAQRLKDQGESIHSLVLLDTKSPGLDERREYHNRQFRWDESRLSKFVRKAYKKVVVSAALKFSHAIPRSQRPFFLMERYRKARTMYHARPFEGDIILIRSMYDNFRNDSLGWKDLVHGSINLVNIGTDHHHITMEPVVKEVAAVFEAIYNGRMIPAKSSQVISN